MKNYVVIIDETTGIELGECENMWKALEIFKEKYPHIERQSRDITLRIIKR
jgi:hypothetical protein